MAVVPLPCSLAISKLTMLGLDQLATIVRPIPLPVAICAER